MVYCAKTFFTPFVSAFPSDVSMVHFSSFTDIFISGGGQPKKAGCRLTSRMARLVGCLPGTTFLRNPGLIFAPYAPGASTASGEAKFEKPGRNNHRSDKISAQPTSRSFCEETRAPRRDHGNV
jgi:hypothetical protein